MSEPSQSPCKTEFNIEDHLEIKAVNIYLCIFHNTNKDNKQVARADLYSVLCTEHTQIEIIFQKKAIDIL